MKPGLPKKSKASPFDFVKAVSETAADPVVEGKLAIEDYNPFLVTRAVSHRVDGADAAAFVAGLEGLTKFQHYRVLKCLVRPRKPSRSEFWARGSLDAGTKIVREYTGFGEEKARETAWAIGEAGVDQMERELKKLSK